MWRFRVLSVFRIFIYFKNFLKSNRLKNYERGKISSAFQYVSQIEIRIEENLKFLFSLTESRMKDRIIVNKNFVPFDRGENLSAKSYKRKNAKGESENFLTNIISGLLSTHH